jgi:hypothetical protein
MAGLLSFMRRQARASDNSKVLACSSTPAPKILATELESELLRPIGEEKKMDYIPELDDPEPQTLSEHIIRSLETAPYRWVDGDSRNVIVHPNGTKLYWYDNYVSSMSDPHVVFTPEEQKNISRAISKCVQIKQNTAAEKSKKRALERWTKTSKGSKPSR